MASGKSLRTDSRKSLSSYCSTMALSMFVALCLVGVWLLTSSDVVPINMLTPETKPNSRRELPKGRTFVDSSGDESEDPKSGTNLDALVDEISTERTVDSQDLEAQEAKFHEESEEAKKDSDDPLIKDGEHDSSLDESGNPEQSENGSGSDATEKFEETQDENGGSQAEEKVEEKLDTGSEISAEERIKEKQEEEPETESADDNQSGKITAQVFPDGAHSEILNETSSQNGAWSTQAMESKNEREAQKSPSNEQTGKWKWKLCNVSAGPDYIPCLDNEEAIKKLPSTKHYEHRERHCPEHAPTCLVPLPEGYRQSIKWPESRDKIWYYNVPHTKLAAAKGHQNWVKVTGEYHTFPGGGTQFKHGALHYIDFIQESLPDIEWGKKTRIILDVGCGVASFGGFLFERGVLAMSFAPKDEHDAQVQFALERGIPAISAVMGTKRLPFPGGVFDAIHCARCRVPWHIEGGMLLLELNRLLRPGGYFIWSATPIYRSVPEDVEIWKAMSKLTKSMCWELVKIKNDTLNEVGVAIFRKPFTNKCYENREQDNPPLCRDSDDPNAAWNVPLQACMHKVAESPSKKGSKWPEQWPKRLEATPYWLSSSQTGVYGKPAPEDFRADYDHWKHVVSKSYMNGMAINWSNVRNVMDMRSIYGGFAAALRDVDVWVMNVVPIDSPDTLSVIYERGLFGIYHDWCESFSTYPRTYDLVHSDHLFSKLSKRCKLSVVIAEVDRLLRPEGFLIVRDGVETIDVVQDVAKSLHWKIRLAYTKENEGLLCVQKTTWRPQEVEAVASGSI